MDEQQRTYILEQAGKKTPKEIARELGLKERTVARFLGQTQIPVTPVSSISPSAESSSIKRIGAAAAAIAVVTFLVYANSLTGKFIWDDDYLVGANPRIKNWSFAGQLFAADIGGGTGQKSSSYRPLQMLTYLVDYSLWHLNVIGYHLTNVLIHILAALAVAWMLYHLFGDYWLALVAGLFFAVHPVHTEAVAYISGRADPLSLLFLALAFVAYLRCGQPLRWGSLAAMSVCYLAALLSREGSFIFPAMILVYHFVFRSRLKQVPFWVSIGLTTAVGLFRVLVIKSFLSEIAIKSTLLQRLPGFFVSITEYVKLLLFPFHLRMEYGITWFSYTHPEALIGAAILIGGIVWALRVRDKDRISSFGILWFFVGLVPVSNIYPINVYMAEHWVYLPSIGFFLFAAKKGLDVYRAGHSRQLVMGLSVVALVFYGVRTIQQNIYWSDSVIFYSRTLKYNASPRMLNCLGQEYLRMGRPQEAAPLFEQASRLETRFVNSQNNLGQALLDMGRVEEAVELFKEAIERDPEDASAYYYLGNVYSRQGDFEKALEFYQKALELNPEMLSVYNSMGIAYAMMGEHGQALEYFKKVLSLNPDSVEANVNVGNSYAANGQIQEAVRMYKQALSLDPGSVEARTNLQRTMAGLSGDPTTL